MTENSNGIPSSKLMIATGWYAGLAEHTNLNRSYLCQTPLWLNHYWLPPLEKYVKPAHYFVYVSNCAVPPVLPLKYFTPISQTIVTGYLPAVDLPHQHDFHATLIQAAAYALNNDFDMLFVEQDCLAWNIPGMLARLKPSTPIAYGFGPAVSFMPDWAEQCLIFVRHFFLREFISRIATLEFLQGTSEYPESLFQRTFKAEFEPFACGVGRRRPIPWDDMFFFQQPRNSEIEKYQIFAKLKQEPSEI